MCFRISISLLLAVILLSGCGQIQGMSLPFVPSPKATVQTPSSPSEGDVAIILRIIDRELEPADVTIQYSTDNGQSFNTATLTVPAEALNLATAWNPGQTHTITWDSVADGIALSGNESIILKITPSDASNPSGTEGYTGTFTVNNTAYNTPPTATLSTPAGTMSGNIPINYFLADAESNACSISVLYSTNGGTSWQAATMGPAGDGIIGLSSSLSGMAHMYLWDSITDGVGLSALVSTVRIRITPSDDFSPGTYGETSSFSVDNSTPNVPPTVTITSGPADSSTVSITQVTYEWTGDDTDGTVTGYYYSFDHDPPDVWTTDTTVTSATLSEGSHTFRIVSVDDQYELSEVESRTFTVSLTGTITADFSASPTSGSAPLTVDFTDLSTATNGITSWSWTFGDMAASSDQNPQHEYSGEGTFTVSLTVTGPDGSDTETKMGYIFVSISSGAIYVDCLNGLDSNNGLSWEQAVRSIGEGIAKAQEGWMILVADGIYAGTNNKNLDFAGKAIYLKSRNGATSCIIDCEGNGRGFYFHNNENINTIIEGLTIRNGNDNNKGGAINCISSSPMITDCIIENNSVSQIGGGGINCESSSAIISNCTLVGNSGGSGYGGAILCGVSSSPTVLNCVVVGNNAGYGSGIACFEASEPSIINSFINNNTLCIHGGGIYARSSINLNITGCVIVSNSGQYGGGIYCYRTPVVTISNCTVASNLATQNYAGGICCYDSIISVDNTIVWGNSCVWGGKQLHIFYSDDDIILTNCDFANGPDDIGGGGTIHEQGVCIYLDPKFNNSTTGDFRLQNMSPCIDAGDNSLIPVGITTDLDGSARVWDGDSDTTAVVDIGAYEFGAGVGAAVKLWGGSYDQYGKGVVVDSNDNIFVAGYGRGFGAGDDDVILLKYNYEPQLQWAKTWGVSTDDRANGIAIDSNDNIYLSGWTRIDGSPETLLLKYNNAGVLEWARSWGGGSTFDADLLDAVVTDTTGNVYVCGHTNTYGAGNDDVLVLKYDNSGNLQWAKTWGGANDDEAFGIAVDSKGDVYVTGYTLSFAPGMWNTLLLKYDSSGVLQWAKTWDGSDKDYAYSIVIDDNDNIYLGGSILHGIVALDDNALIMKYNTSGELQWVTAWGLDNDDCINALTVDDDGNLWAAGYYSYKEDTHSDKRILILEYNSSGDFQSARAWGWYNDDYADGLAIDSVGNLLVAGSSVSKEGSWYEVAGNYGVPSGTEYSPTGTETAPSGVENSPVGTETSPTGDETGSGSGEDYILLKNW